MNATKIALAAVVAALATSSAQAQTAQQTVTFQVNAINQISVAGTPSLTITTAVAGSAPTSVASSGHTWAVTTNQTGAKITASIPSAMPSGVTLTATMGAPNGATSTGQKPLGTTAVDMVTGITKINAAGLSLTYELEATAAAGVVASSTKVVTYTITSGV